MKFHSFRTKQNIISKSYLANEYDGFLIGSYFYQNKILVTNPVNLIAVIIFLLNFEIELSFFITQLVIPFYPKNHNGKQICLTIGAALMHNKMLK